MQAPRDVRAVVFDLDGTLIDSVGDIAHALNLTLGEAGLAQIGATQVRGMIGSGAQVLIERALTAVEYAFSDDYVRQLVLRFEHHYLGLGAGQSHVFDGGRELLTDLAGMGLGLGICTNKPDDVCQKVVAELGLLDHITVVRGVREGIARKPAPDMLLAVLADLGCPSGEALMVGDSAVDVAAARSAGVPVIVVSFGYSAVPVSELGADGVIDQLADVRHFIGGAAAGELFVR